MQTANSRSGVSPSTALEAARQELIQDTVRGAAGRAAAERYADRVDTLLQQLFFEAPPASGPVAILALGGYGRRHLTLHSDVDVLVLFERPIAAEDETFLRGFLHPLWDLHLVVGHQVRELADFAHLEPGNPEFLLALLDARRIVGDPAVYTQFLAAFHRPEAHASILGQLQQLIDERHARFNGTLYQLEPDTKDAPGALRDLLAVRTIARLTDPALLGHGPAEPARLDEAEDFLLRVRAIVHLERKRNQNVLSHELQEKAAQTLGYGGAQPQQRVERMMGDYFRHARIVSRSLEWARKTAPIPVGANLVRAGDGIRFVDPQRAAREPHTWISAFQAAINHETAVADDALALIQQHVDRYAAEDFLPSPAERDALLTFLKPRPGLYARLSEMHDRGLLGRIFPEFHLIFSRVVRDFYHSPRWTSTRCSRSAISSAWRRRRRRAATVSADCSPISPPRSCWCCRSSTTTSASGETTITRSKACGWRGRCSSGWICRPNPAPSWNSSSNTISGCRWWPSAATPRIPDIVKHFAELVGSRSA